MKELTDSQIQQLIKKHFRESLERDERERVTVSRAKTHDECQKDYEECSVVRQAYEWYLAHSDYENVGNGVKQILAEEKIELSPDSYSFRKLCREYAKATVSEMDVLIERLNGDYGKADELAKVFAEPAENRPPATLPNSNGSVPTPQNDAYTATDGKALSEVMAIYVDDKKTEGRWKPRSEVEFRPCLQLLMDVIGDVSV